MPGRFIFQKIPGKNANKSNRIIISEKTKNKKIIFLQVFFTCIGFSIFLICKGKKEERKWEK